jgi:hypothetical protein
MSIIPMTWEVEAKKIAVEGKPRQKPSDAISTDKLLVLIHVCNCS